MMQGVDYVSINTDTSQLLMYAYDPSILRKVAVPLAAIQACSSMEVTTDWRDACIYVLSAAVVKRISDSDMSSIKVGPCSPANFAVLSTKSDSLLASEIV